MISSRFFSLSKRRGATCAGMFSVALGSVLLLCGAGSAPIENLLPQGAMQGDLNAGGHSLTNAATVQATNVNANVVNATNSVTTGTLSINNPSGPDMILYGKSDGSATGAVIRFYNSLVSGEAGHRWSWFQDNTIETGTNVGSNLDIGRYDDAGNILGYPLFIRRSDGWVQIGVDTNTNPTHPFEANGSSALIGGMTITSGTNTMTLASGTAALTVPTGTITLGTAAGHAAADFQTALAFGAGMTLTGTTVTANVVSVAGRTGTIVLSAGDVSGLAASATTDTTNAGNITTGTLSASRLPAFTGSITTSAGSTTAAFAANSVSNSNLATAPAYTVKGNGTSSTGSITDLTVIGYNLFPAIYAPEQYGARHDCKVVTDGVSTSGSGVITSATAAFTSADVGKTVVLPNGVYQRLTGVTSIGSGTVTGISSTTGIIASGGTDITGNGIPPNTTVTSITNGTTLVMSNNATAVASHIGLNPHYLVTTIASYQSATQVTLAASAVASATNLHIYYGTDDTTAIQSAITAAYNSGNGIVWFQPNMYMAAGSLQSLYSGNQNTVLSIPSSATTMANVELRGTGSPPSGYSGFFGYGAAPIGTVLYCPTPGSGTLPSVIAGGGAYGTSNDTVNLRMSNITIRTPRNPTLNGLNALLMNGVDLVNDTADVDFQNRAINMPCSTSTTGFILPNGSNGGMINVRNCEVEDHGAGFRTDYHSKLYGCTAATCYHGVDLNGMTSISGMLMVGNTADFNQFNAGGFGFLMGTGIESENYSTGDFVTRGSFVNDGGSGNGLPGDVVGEAFSYATPPAGGMRVVDGNAQAQYNPYPIICSATGYFHGVGYPMFRSPSSTGQAAWGLQNHSGTEKFYGTYLESYDQVFLYADSASTTVDVGALNGGIHFDGSGNASITGPKLTVPTEYDTSLTSTMAKFDSGHHRIAATANTDYVVPATMTSNTTGTVTFNTSGNSETVYNTSSSTVSTLTMTLPTTAAAGEIMRYQTHGAVTTLTMAGQAVDGWAAPGSLSADSTIVFQCESANGHFVRIY